jgi:hypothetical protein
MPSIPRYNQNSTNDLNYAKRRIVNLEKQGIAKLKGLTVVAEDADKMVDLLIKGIEDLVVLIQRLFGFLGNLEEMFPGGGTAFDWELLNPLERPKVIGLAITSNLQLKRIVRLAISFKKIFNFTSAEKMQRLKNTVEDFENIVEPYIEIIMSVLKKPPTFDANEVGSVVSDLSEDLIFDDETEDYDPFDVDNWLNDTTRDFVDHGIDLLRDYIGPQDDDTDESSDFQTARPPSSRSSRSSRSSGPSGSFQPFLTFQGETDKRQYKKINEEIKKNVNELFRIFNFIFNNYNEARNALQEQVKSRNEKMKQEYTGGSKRVYSVGNKYAEQMYNQSGMYK